MFRPTTPPPTRPRRGAILIVVLALLALFAVVALAFVFYSDSEATIARLAKESQGRNGDGPPPLSQGEYDAIANNALAAVVFGTDDTQPAALLNALRGHGLMDTMYGGVPAAVTGTAPYDVAANVAPSVAFNGAGAIHENLPFGDRAKLPNHTAMKIGPSTFLLDPHWTGQRAVTAGTNLGTAPTLSQPFTRVYVPKNAGYTYPDGNNLIVAAVSPATGQVTVPSLYRAWMFNAANTVNPAYRLAPWNPNDTVNGTDQNLDWIAPEGRAKILRPRPIDQLTDRDFTDAGLARRPDPGLANYPPGPLRQTLYTLISSKIAAGTIIGYPAPNAIDPATGLQTYTGDVQNLAGGVGVQQNDSILIDIGAKEIRWNNRWIKPLVSILLTDLDGLLNLNAHGNAVNSPATPAHGSYGGYGPWEVNPARLFDNETNAARKAAMIAEMTALIQARYGSLTGQPAARNGRTVLAFDPVSALLPRSAQVNWNGAGTAGTPPVQYPAFPADAFRTAPRFDTSPGFFTDNPSDPTGQAQNHPGLYSPGDWPVLAAGSSLTNPFAFPTSDLRRLRQKYAGSLDDYRESAVYNPLLKTVRPAPVPSDPYYSVANPYYSLVGTYPASDAPKQASYRLDPAHPLRLFLTTRSAGLDLPGLMPNYDVIDAGKALQLVAGTLHPVHAPAQFPNPPTAGTGPSDFGTNKTDGRNARAVLGPVDLNRPLADYRNDTSMPLAAANVTPASAAQAEADRQRLARDIFARLVVATGAQAHVLTQPTTIGPVTYQPGDVFVDPSQVPVGTPPYNALRYLAQVAANAVDYTDPDDVSTAFVWNPQDPADPRNAANFAAADLPNRVVFGVEKPRLVVNEVYGEVANDPTENTDEPVTPVDPSKPARVRFWVELLNPTSPAGAGPIGDGTVKLKDGAAQSYRLQVAKDGAAASAELAKPENVLGNLGATINPEIEYKFPAGQVAPNNGQYQANGDPTKGAVVFGPQIGTVGTMTGPQPFEFNPRNTAPAGPWATNMVEAPPAPANAPRQDALDYQVVDGGSGPPPRAALHAGDDYKHHVVLLQRLANPYLPESVANPYVTVDYMAEVPAFDAVNRAKGEKKKPMTDGFVPKDKRFAFGKVQPYAGMAGPVTPQADGTVNTAPFPNAFVVKQDPAPTAEPLHTLGRHNGKTPAEPTDASMALPGLPTETIMAPFDWLVHPDRPLVNAAELFHLQAVKPHQVTQYFLQPVAAVPVHKGAGQVPWLGVTAAGQPAFDPTTGLPVFDTAATNQRSRNGLYRALDLLRVKPWGYGVGVGGRVHGRVNINTIADARILKALLDRQAANDFTDADVDALWEALFNPTTAVAGVPYRTRLMQPLTLADGTTVNVPVPGPTFDDDPALTDADRPFKPFGGADLPQGPLVAAAAGGSGLQDTLLRVDPNAGPAQGRPLAWLPPSGILTHPYQHAEVVRKLLNNVTTVSNAFAVHVTVVWHEVRADAGNVVYYDEGMHPNGQPLLRPLLGKEAYRETPGDMRRQYFAVIDRSNLLLAADPAQPNKFASPPRVVARPVSTALEARADAGVSQITVPAVADPANGNQPAAVSDGVLVPLAGSTVVIGVGATAEVRTVSGAAAVAVGPGGGTTSVLTLSNPPLYYPHAIGESVANGIPGHPGPQAVNVVGTGPSPHRAVIPYVQRVSR